MCNGANRTDACSWKELLLPCTLRCLGCEFKCIPPQCHRPCATNSALHLVLWRVTVLAETIDPTAKLSLELQWAGPEMLFSQMKKKMNSIDDFFPPAGIPFSGRKRLFYWVLVVSRPSKDSLLPPSPLKRWPVTAERLCHSAAVAPKEILNHWDVGDPGCTSFKWHFIWQMPFMMFYYTCSDPVVSECCVNYYWNPPNGIKRVKQFLSLILILSAQTLVWHVLNGSVTFTLIQWQNQLWIIKNFLNCLHNRNLI